MMANHQHGPIRGVAGVILAGGESRRMGSNKALLPYRGGHFIEAVHRRLALLFAEVIVVTDRPGHYPFLTCRMVADHYPGAGALAGLQAGLAASTEPLVFAVACDMPCLDQELIRHLAARSGGADVVIPEGEKGAEPLHALYAKGCLPAMEEALAAGERRIAAIFGRVAVCRIPREEVALIDPELASFTNINTPADYRRLLERERAQRVARDPATDRHACDRHG